MEPLALLSELRAYETRRNRQRFTTNLSGSNHYRTNPNNHKKREFTTKELVIAGKEVQCFQGLTNMLLEKQEEFSTSQKQKTPPIGEGLWKSTSIAVDVQIMRN